MNLTNTQEVKDFILSFPESNFINWFNDFYIGSYDIISACFQENTEENLQRVMNRVESVYSDYQPVYTNYKPTDKYFFSQENIIESFNTIREFLESHIGSYVLEDFLNYYDPEEFYSIK